MDGLSSNPTRNARVWCVVVRVHAVGGLSVRARHIRGFRSLAFVTADDAGDVGKLLGGVSPEGREVVEHTARVVVQVLEGRRRRLRQRILHPTAGAAVALEWPWEWVLWHALIRHPERHAVV
eukprot:100020-Prymnesium_polylepis.2